MNIRRKMFIFIPMLVLLMSFVSFFLFESSKNVQESYSLIMDRILLYKQISREGNDIVRSLNRYVIQMDADSYPELEEHVASMEELLKTQQELGAGKANSMQLGNYRNMSLTFLEQARSMIGGINEQDSNTKAGAYIEVEELSRYIGEEGQALVDLELEQYRPVYQNIMGTTSRMNTIGVYLVFTVALLSIVLSLWLSNSITGPIRRLVLTAKQISKGKLDTKAPEMNTNDEIGILCQTFNRMLDNIQDLMDKNVKGLERDKLVKELELKALQSQINPHFLFNTLNSISKLAYIEGAEKTSDLTVSVSKLLRYNLQKLDHPVQLRDEVEHAREYMTIQKARFRDRILFAAEIDEDAMNQMIPCLTIQPILENALIHGIEGMEEGARLSLIITREPEHVQIVISDNGTGMGEETRKLLLQSAYQDQPRSGMELKRKSTGLGTANVFKRLELFYAGRQTIDIDSGEGRGTRVVFRLPVQEAGG